MGDPWKRREVIGDCTLYLGDCLSVLPTLGPVDAVVTDPPYGIGEHGGKTRYGPASAARGFSSCKYYENKGWDKESADQEVLQALTAFPAIIWGANHFISKVPVDSPFWLVWHKKGSDRSSFADCELAWTNLPGSVRYFKYDWVGFGAINSGEKRVHETQKPLPLMKWCLGFLPDAHTILDPFMGSGTTLVACANLGRSGIGIERNPAHFETACRRVEEAYRQPDFFVERPKPAEQLSMLGEDNA